MKRLALAGLTIAAVLIAAGAGTVLWSPLPLAGWVADPYSNLLLTGGFNPHPVILTRPPVPPLSAMALLGKKIFFDSDLSSSRRLSCASCHDPLHAYGPGGAVPAAFGGPRLADQGMRAVPSLMYLERQPNFSIGPDNAENETVNLAGLAVKNSKLSRSSKIAQQDASAVMVPQGGLFWDGRADTLQDQALNPLTSASEMDGGSIEEIAGKLQRSAYAWRFAQLFGSAIFTDAHMTVAEAMFAVARFEIEEPGFHPYASKYDHWLEGKAQLSPTELRGYLAFNDPAKGNCAACHLDQPSPDGLPPLFTDHQFEALGVPRNPDLIINRDPRHLDLGLCDRDDMKDVVQYCGLFSTPSLRNSARRQSFFHNGVYHSLSQVLDFYNFRDSSPGRIYPRAADGGVAVFNDLPARYRANIDRIDGPFSTKQDTKPAMSAEDEKNIVAFLNTLNDN
jgi:cytochrome c peroxidase